MRFNKGSKEEKKASKKAAKTVVIKEDVDKYEIKNGTQKIEERNFFIKKKHKI